MMKNIFYSTLFCAGIFLASCHNGKEVDTDLITIDLSENYPLNDAIPIQQLGKVEYIPLETDSVFLCDGQKGIRFINNEFIIFYNITNNDFLIFNREGKAMNKFNRHGQGPGDYFAVFDLMYDEKRQELFMNNSDQFLQIYDLQGNFKRRLINVRDFIPAGYIEFSGFNENLLLYSTEPDSSGARLNKFMVFSKQSGEKVKEIISLDDPATREYFTSGERSVLIDKIYDSGYWPRIVVKDTFSFYNSEPWSDTISEFSEDLNSKIPVIVRQPSFFTSDFKGLLFLDLVTRDHYFLRFYRTHSDSPEHMTVNRKTKQITLQNFYNEDDLNKKKIYFGLSGVDGIRKVDDNTCYMLLDAFNLKEAYHNDELKGELKEIAAKIREDDNPVLMIIDLETGNKE
ncbi:MAG: 6-bladed beta-propeller [Tannerella sp.]|jgi:hypothetical protein|nr:6-bladed beta-propeller [Tannerella sp.]